MAENPEGQSCGNCSFYIGASCRAVKPISSFDAPRFPSVNPEDWCVFWIVWPGSLPAPAVEQTVV